VGISYRLATKLALPFSGERDAENINRHSSCKRFLEDFFGVLKDEANQGYNRRCSVDLSNLRNPSETNEFQNKNPLS
jgi:hypothetical protein